MPAPTMQMVLTTLADAKLVSFCCFIHFQHFYGVSDGLPPRIAMAGCTLQSVRGNRY